MKNSMIYKAFSRVFFAAVYVNYIFLICTLSWLVVAPDSTLAMSTYEHSEWINDVLCSGFVLGFLLSAFGAARAVANAEVFYNNKDSINMVASLVDALVCFSMGLLPSLIFKNTIVIRESVEPAIWVTLTSLFISIVTQHYFRAKRTRQSLKECGYA